MKGTPGAERQTCRTQPAPGRPGRAAVVPTAPSPLPPAGYEPGKLDASLRKYLAVCETSIRHAESIGKQVKTYLERLASAPSTGTDAASQLSDANQATILFERLTKAGLNLVKATDELSRLRSFLAGGPDSRPDLTISGEIALRGIIFSFIRDMGWKLVDQKGQVIDVEAQPAA